MAPIRFNKVTCKLRTRLRNHPWSEQDVDAMVQSLRSDLENLNLVALLGRLNEPKVMTMIKTIKQLKDVLSRIPEEKDFVVLLREGSGTYVLSNVDEWGRV